MLVDSITIKQDLKVLLVSHPLEVHDIRLKLHYSNVREQEEFNLIFCKVAQDKNLIFEWRREREKSNHNTFFSIVISLGFSFGKCQEKLNRSMAKNRRTRKPCVCVPSLISD